jgi:alanine racemase
MVTVSTLRNIKSFTHCYPIKKTSPIQIKIDTGMGRLGVDISQAYDFIKQALKLQNDTQSVLIKGIYTHLAAVEDDEEFTQSQLAPFRSLVNQLRKDNISLDYIHASSSGGILFENNDLFNTFRPGLITYG